jgi:predicted methyltransferase
VKAELFFRGALLASAALLATCGGMGGNESIDYRALVASPERSDADRQTDQRRKPELLLAFTGVRPGMKVLDMGAGGGYSTELLARATGPGGTVYAQDSARSGAGVSVAKSLHRIEESALRREVEAAGFRLVAEADFLRNPSDARDAIVFRPKAPVDEFVLKFVRP